MKVELYDYQLEALNRMKNGCILCGGVGSGKSMTSLGYFYKRNGGDLNRVPFTTNKMKDLYIITTARKRDTCEWEKDMSRFLLSPNEELNPYKNKIVIDSWNNIGKYARVKDAFFIFDEQRVVGYGKWSKTFIHIAKNNEWILLSATPGDSWMDYMPVFIANGFYRNKTDFTEQHVQWARYTKYPKIDRYYNTRRLVRLRDSILIDMDFKRKTISHHLDYVLDYDIWKYKFTIRDRQNIDTGEPFKNAAELCYTLRKITNTDPSRIEQVIKIANEKNRVIVFYNFDYELDILKNAYYGDEFEIAEWNGHAHQPIPESDKWIYLVQYTAGAEGWNCIKTDTIIFYSQNYSYKVMEQASGRIDRLNTPYTDLYYYHLRSKSSIDVAITKALSEKKKFNESRYCSKLGFDYQKVA